VKNKLLTNDVAAPDLRDEDRLLPARITGCLAGGEKPGARQGGKAASRRDELATPVCGPFPAGA
jgi:hypothetical protein